MTGGAPGNGMIVVRTGGSVIHAHSTGVGSIDVSGAVDAVERVELSKMVVLTVAAVKISGAE